MTRAPLLPDAYFSAFVTYWRPMTGRKFMSSGNVWFDYRAQCFRIDGLFNPWDVEGTQQHLWMSELTHYGRGISHHLALVYDRVPNGTEGEHEVASRKLVRRDVAIHEAIFPQAYLRDEHAELEGQDSILGVDVDVWRVPSGNRLAMGRVWLRRGSNELVRMEQFKRGDHVVRDFPNLIAGPVPAHVFSPEYHEFAGKAAPASSDDGFPTP